MAGNRAAVMKRIFFTLINDLTYDQRMQRIARSLTQAGFSVRLIGRHLPDSQPVAHAPYEQKRLHLWFRRGKAFYVEYNLRLFFYLLVRRFDALCATDLDTLPACFLAARLKRKPCIYDAHELFPEVPEVVRRPMVRRLWRLAERMLVPHTPRGYTVSAGISRYFQQTYGVDYAVIRNVPWLSAEDHNRPEKAHPPVILYQGALNEGRGLECLIEVMSDVPAELWLAGEGDRSQQLRQLVEQHRLQHKVHFLGRIPPDRLPQTTGRATIGVNLLTGPSLNYQLSLANKFFDYVHAGLPQITMNYEEYRRHNEQWEVAVLIDRTEPRILRQALQQLLEDQQLYRRLQDNCLQARRHWNWQQEQQQLITLYRQWL